MAIENVFALRPEGEGPSDQLESGAISVGERTLHLDEIEGNKAQLVIFARELSAIYARERRQAKELDSLVSELKTTYLAMVQTLAFMVEAKDEYTRYHLERCRDYASALAEVVDPELAGVELQFGYLLHDIGKIGIPESIVSKAGPLSASEMRVMRTHPLLGVQFVQPMRFLDSRAVSVIRNHHERFDGNGYPDGLKGGDIPMAARIFSVADAFDAMTTDRPYRKALTFDEALHRIQAGSGKQFDPGIVTAFELLLERLPRKED